MRSVIDWYSLATDGLFSARGKLATIWFNEIVLHVPTKGLVERVLESLKKRDRLSDETVSILADTWIPYQDRSTKDHFLDDAVWDRADIKTRNAITYEIQHQVRRRYGQEHADTYAEMREVALGGAGFLSALELWKLLNDSEPTSFFGNSYSSKLFSAVIQTSDQSQFRNFEKVASIPMPDLSNVSWDRIVELKNNQYFFDFRSMLQRISNDIERADERQLKELVAEMKLAEMKDIVKAAEPNIGFATVNAVIGNIPILDNIGKLRDIRDVWRAIKRKRQSGWLYFLMNMEDAADRD